MVPRPALTPPGIMTGASVLNLEAALCASRGVEGLVEGVTLVPEFDKVGVGAEECRAGRPGGPECSTEEVVGATEDTGGTTVVGACSVLTSLTSEGPVEEQTGASGVATCVQTCWDVDTGAGTAAVIESCEVASGTGSSASAFDGGDTATQSSPEAAVGSSGRF